MLRRILFALFLLAPPAWAGPYQGADANPANTTRIKSVWYVSTAAAITDHGDDTTTGSLAWIALQISTDPGVIEAPPATYTVAQALTIGDGTAKNITYRPQPGAIISHSTHPVQVNGLVDAGPWQIFSGTGTVTLTDKQPFVRPEWFGATGDGTTDDAAAIQRAVDAAATIGKAVVDFRPQATYLMDCATEKTWAGAGNILACIVMKDGVSFRGHETTLKAKDDISPAGAPVNYAMFFSNEHLYSITIEGFRFDLNGANNPSGGTTNNNAAIMFSSDSSGCDDLLIQNNKFLNFSGASVIVTSQTDSVPAGAYNPKRNRILNNRFYTTLAIMDSTDHSAIFLRAEDSEVAGNSFEFDQIRTDDVGVAVEIQGRGNRMHHNVIRNYFQGAWVTGNFTTATYGVSIDHNDFYVKGVGVDFFREGAAETAIYDVNVSDNTITLEDTTTSIDVKAGVQITAKYTVRDVSIVGNTITKVGTVTKSAGLNVATNLLGQAHTRISFRGNHVYATYMGVNCNTATGAIGELVVTGNDFTNLSNAGGDTSPTAILIYANGQVISRVVATGNAITDDRGTPQTDFGVWIGTNAGGMVSFAAVENTCFGVTTAYAEAGTMDTSMERYGYDALSGNSIPTSGKFTRGQFFRIPDPAEYGSALSKYTILGWDRLTTGTNHIDGTDWVQRRALTGN